MVNIFTQGIKGNNVSNNPSDIASPDNQTEEEKKPTPYDDDDENEDYSDKYSGGFDYEVVFPSSQVSPITPETIEKLDLIHKAENELPPFEVVFSANPNDENSITENDIFLKEDLEQVFETHEESKKLLIGLKEFIVEELSNATKELTITGTKKGKCREYNKTAEMPKITFAKPAQQNGKVKLFMFLGACIALGIYTGVLANSYYWFTGAKNSAVSCAFSWVMSFDEMSTIMSPINWSVFFTSFFIWAGILGIIGLFIWLDNDSKKQSRVGHEHGASRLGSKRDYKQFKNRFMEK